MKCYTCSFNLEIAVWVLKQASCYLNHSLPMCVFRCSEAWLSKWPWPASACAHPGFFCWWQLVGGDVGSLCLGLFKADSCLPEHVQCGLCRRLAWPCGWTPSAPLHGGGRAARSRKGFSSSPPASLGSLEILWAFHPKFVSRERVYIFGPCLVLAKQGEDKTMTVSG